MDYKNREKLELVLLGIGAWPTTQAMQGVFFERSGAKWTRVFRD
jgi:hypothetical protein